MLATQQQEQQQQQPETEAVAEAVNLCARLCPAPAPAAPIISLNFSFDCDCDFEFVLGFGSFLGVNAVSCRLVYCCKLLSELCAELLTANDHTHTHTLREICVCLCVSVVAGFDRKLDILELIRNRLTVGSASSDAARQTVVFDSNTLTERRAYSLLPAVCNGKENQTFFSTYMYINS